VLSSDSVNLPLKYSRAPLFLGSKSVARIMVQSGPIREGSASAVVPTSKRARGVLDISGTKLVDRPSFLEEKLRRMQGVIDAEINAFSNRITVEFDPSLITLDKIKASLARRNGS
jgi:hypothetical protein